MAGIRVSEALGQKGAYPLISKLLERHDLLQEAELASLAEGAAPDDLSALVSQLCMMGIISATSGGYYLSSYGQRTGLLLKAINGDLSVGEAIRYLQILYPHIKPYELITESLTEAFVERLLLRPDFIRLYICSPWIRLKQDILSQLAAAVSRASERYPNAVQVLVVTRPPPTGDAWGDQIRESLRSLRRMGASISVHAKLHAKLYIRDPGPYGGLHSALFGSENLTGAQNVEIGISIINDSEILRKLTVLFFSIQEEAKIWRE